MGKSGLNFTVELQTRVNDGSEVCPDQKLYLKDLSVNNSM